MALTKDDVSKLLAIGSDLYRDNTSPDIEKVAGMFPRGFISIVASSAGTGKTWLMQYISCQLSVGGRILGGMVAKSKPMKSIIMSGETGKFMLDKRLASTSWEYEPSRIRVYAVMDFIKASIPYTLNSKEGQETIAKIVEIERPDVIWFDTLISFHTADESKQADMTHIYSYLLRMASYYNIAVVLNHHMRKRPNNRKGEGAPMTQDEVIGSSAGVRLANSVYLITREDVGEGMSKQTVRNVKSWDKRVPDFTYKFVNDEHDLVDFEIDFDTEGRNLFWSLKERLMSYIQTFNVGAMFSANDAAKALSVNVDTVRGYLEKLSGNGYSSRDKKGQKYLERVTVMDRLMYKVR